MSVYFAQVGPYIKIGFSATPERRVRRLFSGATRYSTPDGTPLDLASRHLIRAIDGDVDTERAIHHALDDFRVGEEWFVDEPEVRAFIATATTRSHYPKVGRPDGPARDELGDGLTDAEREQLTDAMRGLLINST